MNLLKYYKMKQAICKTVAGRLYALQRLYKPAYCKLTIYIMQEIKNIKRVKDCYHITFIDSNGIEKTGITEHGGEINEKIDGDESKAELSWKQTPANIIRITKFNK